MTLVSGIYKDYADIRGGFLGEGASNDSGVIESVDFRGFRLSDATLRHLGNGPTLSHSIIYFLVIFPVPLSPKHMVLNDLEILNG